MERITEAELAHWEALDGYLPRSAEKRLLAEVRELQQLEDMHRRTAANALGHARALQARVTALEEALRTALSHWEVVPDGKGFRYRHQGQHQHCEAVLEDKETP